MKKPQCSKCGRRLAIGHVKDSVSGELIRFCRECQDKALAMAKLSREA